MFGRSKRAMGKIVAGIFFNLCICALCKLGVK